MRLPKTLLLASCIVVSCLAQTPTPSRAPERPAAFSELIVPTAAPTATITPNPPHATAPSATLGETPTLISTLTSPANVQTLPAPVVSFAADPNDSHAMYALLVTNALYRTLDGGRTWQKLPLPAPEQPFEPPPIRPNSVFLVPQQDVRFTNDAPGFLFVRANWTLYRSDDDGKTWQTLPDQVTAWTLDESDAQQIYAWREGDLPHPQTGLYRSDDRGATWQQLYAGFFPPFLKDEAFSPNHEGLTSLALDAVAAPALYAGTDFGIYRSLNGGRTWQEFSVGLPPNQRAYRWTPLMVSGDLPGPFALTETSPDGNSTHPVLARLQHGAIIPDQDSWQVLAQDTFTQFDRSSDSGFNGVHTLVRDPTVNTRLYLGTAQGLFISDDAGETWRAVEPRDAGAVYRIGVAPGDETRLYLWTEHGLVTSIIPAFVLPTRSDVNPTPTSTKTQTTARGRIIAGYGAHEPIGGLPLWVGKESIGMPVARTDTNGEFTVTNLPNGVVDIVDDHLSFHVPHSASDSDVTLGVLKYPLIHPPTFYLFTPPPISDVSQLLRKGQTVPFTICQTDEKWTRPTDSVQRAVVWSRPPFRDLGEAALRWWGEQPAVLYDTMDIFTQSFPDGPNLDALAVDWRYLLGMWTGADLSQSQCAYDARTLEDLLNREQVEVWLLGYRATQIRRLEVAATPPPTRAPANSIVSGAHYALQVTPAPGFQIIRFRGNGGALAVHVVSQGKEILTLPKFCYSSSNLDCTR